MPTYDYQCQDCGHTFEVFQMMSAKKLTKCPRCQGRLKRLLGTGAGIIFKGSGFYATDYRSPTYQAAAKKEKDAATASSTMKSSGEKKKNDSTSSKASSSSKKKKKT